MLAYITVGTNDLALAGRFYDAILAPLGGTRVKTSAREIGYALHPNRPISEIASFWVLLPFDGKAATFGNGVDVAFNAPSRAAVDCFHAAALANGGSDEGAPGLRPHYGPTFYTAYVRDPDGNKLNAVCDRP